MPQSLADGECSLGASLWDQFDLPVAAVEVKGNEPAGPSDIVKSVNVWKGVGVFPGVFVQTPVVNTELPVFVVLSNQDHWYCQRAV